MAQYHMFNGSMLPVGLNTYKPDKLNYIGFYVKEIFKNIDSFDFPNLLSEEFKKWPDSAKYICVSAEEVNGHPDCIKVKIAVRAGQRVDIAFNILKEMDEKSLLLSFSKAGFEDWIPADELTLQLIVDQKPTNHGQEVIIQKPLKEDGVKEDEGFFELEEIDQATKSEETKLIDEVQVIKDKMAKLKGVNILSRKDLQEIRVAYEGIFKDKYEVNQYINKVITIGLPAIEHGISMVNGNISSKSPRLEAVILEKIMSLEDAASFVQGADIICTLYHLYTISKNLYETYQAWEKLTKENTHFKAVVLGECPDMRDKLKDISKVLEILCEALAGPSPPWQGVIETIKNLVNRLFELDAKVMSISLTLNDITKNLKNERGKVNARWFGAVIATIGTTSSLFFGWNQLSNANKIILTVATASTSAFISGLSFVTSAALGDAINAQAKVCLSMQELHIFLEKYRVVSETINGKIHLEFYSEKSAFYQTFCQMKIDTLKNDALLKELEASV